MITVTRSHVPIMGQSVKCLMRTAIDNNLRYWDFLPPFYRAENKGTEIFKNLSEITWFHRWKRKTLKGDPDDRGVPSPVDTVTVSQTMVHFSFGT